MRFVSAENGCYYNYNHYGEGDRIVTNEPCLNCTCHNRMLMCYLRVCPFTKPIGQDCIVEKREDQCCPIITCPEGNNCEILLTHSLLLIWPHSRQYQLSFLKTEAQQSHRPTSHFPTTTDARSMANSTPKALKYRRTRTSRASSATAFET